MRGRGGNYGRFRPYVRVSERHAMAAREGFHARQRGETLDPIEIRGRAIATTTWGRAWCDHIESFHDFANRLPRGRTYVRNGSVYHLAVAKGQIRARVAGSDLYEQWIDIAPCEPAAWQRVKKRCSGGIGSLIELLEGRISSEVMQTMTAEKNGLLPDLKHVDMRCSCPDWAYLCKHLAAVLYGVGARLDVRPELLFTLRGVDPADLVDTTTLPGQRPRRGKTTRLVGNLSSVFGVEIDEEPASPAERAKQTPSKTRRGKSQPARHSATTKPTRRSRARKAHRRDLLDRGVPPGTIATWLRQGVLEATDERGVYRHTRESRARIGRYQRP